MIEFKPPKNLPIDMLPLKSYLMECEINFPLNSIYFLLKNKTIIYIGQSTNLLSRINDHTEEGKDFDRVLYYEVNSNSDLTILETIFIKRFQPILNQQKNKKKKNFILDKFEDEYLKKKLPEYIYDSLFKGKIKIRQSNKFYLIGKIKRNKRKNNNSAYKGVFWNKEKGRWVAKINHDNKIIYLGAFNSQIDAAIAYDKKAIELDGDNASLNYPEYFCRTSHQCPLINKVK